MYVTIKHSKRYWKYPCPIPMNTRNTIITWDTRNKLNSKQLNELNQINPYKISMKSWVFLSLRAGLTDFSDFGFQMSALVVLSLLSQRWGLKRSLGPLATRLSLLQCCNNFNAYTNAVREIIILILFNKKIHVYIN